MEENRSNVLENADSLTLAKAVASVLMEKKALDVRVYNAGEGNSVTDYYVNATGRSSTNVMALADEVTYKIGLQGRGELRVEGRAGKSWLLVDYGDVIVNIFDRPSREFYNFDRLFTEDALVDISDVAAEIDKKYEINNTAKDN